MTELNKLKKAIETADKKKRFGHVDALLFKKYAQKYLELAPLLEETQEEMEWDLIVKSFSKEASRGLANWLAHGYKIVGFSSVFLWRDDMAEDEISYVKPNGRGERHTHRNKPFFEQLLTVSDKLRGMVEEKKGEKITEIMEDK